MTVYYHPNYITIHFNNLFKSIYPCQYLNLNPTLIHINLHNILLNLKELNLYRSTIIIYPQIPPYIHRRIFVLIKFHLSFILITIPKNPTNFFPINPIPHFIIINNQKNYFQTHFLKNNL